MKSNQTASYKLIERPIYGSSRVGIDNTELELVGYTAPTDGITTHILGLKQYELVNHLGNVLRRVEPVETTTITDKKIPVENNGAIDHYVADITSATDYYPFGSPMDGRNFSSDKYRFGFNGKENDNEMKSIGNSLDFGARIYDSRIGRWLSLDPLQAKYPDLTPYNFKFHLQLYFQV
jgi:RHS repeat-associated protein